MTPEQKAVAALLAACDMEGGKPASTWPEYGDVDNDDWIVGRAKYSWDGPYYAVTAAEIEEGDTPGMYEQIATCQSRTVAEALVAVLNGGAT